MSLPMFPTHLTPATIDRINESLLDTLTRKPDHSFGAFVAALRSSDQHHIANLLAESRDTPTIPVSKVQLLTP